MKIKLKYSVSLILALALLFFPGCSFGTRPGGNTTYEITETHRPAQTDEPEVSATTPPETEAEDELRFSKVPLEIELNAKQAFVYDVDKEEFLLLKGQGERLNPASTTKVLTILYAMTLVSPDELITPGDELLMLGEFSTLAYIKPFHTLTAEMLAEGMLLPSGNDAAHVLAAAAGKKLAGDSEMSGRDAVAAFMEGMNKYAAAIGMKGSHFVTPDGYPDEDHYTTAEDMAIVADMAVHNSLIMKYARMHQDDVTYASGHTNSWVNTNKLLDPYGGYYSPYATGLKTGSADDNDFALIASADIEGRTYIIGLFTEELANNRYIDALAVINALEARL